MLFESGEFDSGLGQTINEITANRPEVVMEGEKSR
jgi:hypothetical protein